jgi:hypothetical protein
MSVLYRICMNMMPLPNYTDRHHCCNKAAVSVGIHFNFYSIHDLFFPFLFLFLQITGGIHR